jgi:hypothetical protein
LQKVSVTTGPIGLVAIDTHVSVRYQLSVQQNQLSVAHEYEQVKTKLMCGKYVKYVQSIIMNKYNHKLSMITYRLYISVEQFN